MLKLVKKFIQIRDYPKYKQKRYIRNTIKNTYIYYLIKQKCENYNDFISKVYEETIEFLVDKLNFKYFDNFISLIINNQKNKYF